MVEKRINRQKITEQNRIAFNLNVITAFVYLDNQLVSNDVNRMQDEGLEIASKVAKFYSENDIEKQVKEYDFWDRPKSELFKPLVEELVIKGADERFREDQYMFLLWLYEASSFNSKGYVPALIEIARVEEVSKKEDGKVVLNCKTAPVAQITFSGKLQTNSQQLDFIRSMSPRKVSLTEESKVIVTKYQMFK